MVQGTGTEFSSLAHLFGRWPELRDADEVAQFISRGVSAWGEADDAEGTRYIYLWSSDRSRALHIVGPRITAFSLPPPTNARALTKSTWLYPLFEDKRGLLVAERAEADTNVTTVIDPSSGDVVRTTSTQRSRPVVHDDVRAFGESDEVTVASDDQPATWSSKWIKADWLASNDLIHPAFMLDEAQKARGTAAEPRDIVQRLANHVRTTYRFRDDATMKDFAHSDRKVVEKFNRAGDCLEFATILGSLCRALVIPTRMVYFSWRAPDRVHMHAFIEFFDKRAERWTHADGLWKNAFDNPHRYRDSEMDGTTEWKAWLVGMPDDSLSSAAAASGAADPDGDGSLHPWKDFKVVWGPYSKSPYGGM